MTDKCRSDHFELISRHLKEMVAEISEPFIGVDFDLPLYRQFEHELAVFEESFRSYGSLMGHKGLWPEVYFTSDEW